MIDPAWGSPKAHRALGEHMTNRSRQFLVNPDLRVDNVGMFRGRVPTYGRHGVRPDLAADVIRRNRVTQ